MFEIFFSQLEFPSLSPRICTVIVFEFILPLRTSSLALWLRDCRLENCIFMSFCAKTIISHYVLPFKCVVKHRKTKEFLYDNFWQKYIVPSKMVHFCNTSADILKARTNLSWCEVTQWATMIEFDELYIKPNLHTTWGFPRNLQCVPKKISM